MLHVFGNVPEIGYQFSGLDREANRHLVGLVVGPLLSIFILILFILCFQVEDEVRAKASWRAT